MNINRVTLGGRLTRDVELKTLPNGTVIAEFGLAVNETYGENEYTNFFDCTAFAKTAESVAKFFQKGRPILIEGRLRFESWEKDGQKRSKVTVRVENFHFVDSLPPKTDGNTPAAASNTKTVQVKPVVAKNVQKPPF